MFTRPGRAALQLSNRICSRQSGGQSRTFATSTFSCRSCSVHTTIAKRPVCVPGQLLSPSRLLSTEHRASTSFTIQDYDDFQQRVVHSSEPVIVDFFADWCGPCKLLAPRLESLVDARQGRVMLAKINVDDHADLAMDYDVSSVPTVLAFKHGKMVDKFVGLQEDESIECFLDKISKSSLEEPYN